MIRGHYPFKEEMKVQTGTDKQHQIVKQLTTIKTSWSPNPFKKVSALPVLNFEGICDGTLGRYNYIKQTRK